MKQRLVKLFAIVTALTAVVGLSTGHAQSDKSRIAIKVNGETVKQSELEKSIDRTYQRMKQRYGKKLKGKKMKNRLRQRIRKQIIQQRVDRLVLKTKAKESGISVSEEDVNKRIKSATKRFGSKKKFEQILQKQGLTLEKFRQQVRDQLLVQNFVKSKIGTVSVSDKRARQYYEKNKKRFKKRSYKQLKPRIKQALKQRKKKKKRQKLVNRLRKKSEVDIRV